jgi:hypothetical protein
MCIVNESGIVKGQKFTAVTSDLFEFRAAGG